jgi:molybdopterin synthase sulfur carrier subunit
VAASEVVLPPDIKDVERLLFMLSRRRETWKSMPLGNPRLNGTSIGSSLECARQPLPCSWI